MNSPSTHSSLLTARNSPSPCEMSSSLRERLKKCGRYHPGTSSSKKPADTPISATSVLNSSYPRMSNDICVDVHNSKTCHTTTLDSAQCSTVTPNSATSSTPKHDDETPKRRKLGGISTQSSTDKIKRRRLECSEENFNENSNDDCQVEAKLLSHEVLINNQNIEFLTEKESITNEIGLSRAYCLVNKCDESNMIDSHVTGSDMHPGSSSQIPTIAMLKDSKTQLEKELKAKDEQLRKLKMVKMYREKNDLTELQRLIDIWRDVSQRALVDLHSRHPPPRPSMTELVNHLQIDHELIHYEAEEEAFS